MEKKECGQEKDYTKGPIVRYFAQLTIPLVAGNILQQLYNLIDAMVIGWYAGEEEFAAIGVASSVMNLFLFAIVGACVGVSVLLAQLYGAKDWKRFRQEHFLALLMGLGMSVILAVAGAMGSNVLLKELQTPAEILDYAKIYLNIVLAALPASFLYNFYNALLRSAGRVKVSLGILALAMLTNLGLDLLFVIRFHAGTAGVAWATLIAQVCAAGCSLVYVFWQMPQLSFRKEDCRMDRNLAMKTIHYCGVTGLQQTGLYLGKLLVQGAVNTMGTAAIAAYTATTRIEGFSNSFGDSGCSATSVLTAQNYGAKNQERVRETMKISFLILGGMGLICSAIMFLAAEPLTRLVMGTGNSASCEMAVTYLRMIAVAYPLCFTGNTFAGHFDGIGRVSVSMAGTVTHIAMRTVLSWIFIGRFGLGTVAAATGIGWLYVNLFWGRCFRNICSYECVKRVEENPG